MGWGWRLVPGEGGACSGLPDMKWIKSAFPACLSNTLEADLSGHGRGVGENSG